MTYTPIAFISPNYRDYKNYWLKAYEPGTTAPKSMSLDSGGVTLVAKLQLNADGFLVSAGNALVIPYIDGAYDLWLFPTEAEADANNTVNAERLADDINASGSGGSLSQAYVFDTVADMVASNIVFPVGKAITTNGYYQNSDGGGASYLVSLTSSVTVNDYYILQSTSTVTISFVLNKTGNNHAKQFGSYGNGSANDTLSIQAAINSGYSFSFVDGNFLAAGLLFNEAFKTYECFNSTLGLHQSAAKIGVVSANGVRFRNMVFTGMMLSASECLIKTENGLSSLEFSYCTFKDILGTTTSAQYGLFVNAYGARCQISNCTFQNIQSTNTTGTATSAFCGGVILFGDGTYAQCDISVFNCAFRDIFTNNISGNIDLSDADGVRIAGNATSEPLTISLKDNQFVGIQKSAIKVSGAQGVEMSGNYIDGTRTDLPMIAGIRVQNSDDSSIFNTTLKGNIERLFNIRSNDLLIDGVKYIRTTYAYTTFIAFNFQSYASGVDTLHDITILNVDLSWTYRAIDVVDVHTNGTARFIKNLTIKNWVVRVNTAATSMFKVKNVNRFSVSDVMVSDENEILSDLFEFTDCDNISISNVIGGCVRHIVQNINNGSSSSNNLKISDCDFKRFTSAQAQNTRFLEWRTLGKGFTLENTKLSHPSYDILGNTQTVTLDGDNISVSNIDFVARDEGGTNRVTSELYIMGGTLGLLSGVKFITDVVTDQLNVYAVNLANTEKFTVTDVTSNSRGVFAEASSNNTFISNVSANNNAIINAGTNAATGTSVIWV